MSNTKLRFCFIVTGIFSVLLANAQRDSTQSISITTEYQPVLRNAAKLNFSGTPLPADTNRTVAPYYIPPQNLFYAYQPIPLRPLALVQDTNLYLGNRHFIKAGVGNYTTGYAAAGLGFGDGKKYLLNITGNFVSSKGKDIEFQNFYNLNAKAAGSYFINQNELYGSLCLAKNDYSRYGYNHTLYNYSKADVIQHLQELNLTAGFRNLAENSLGVNYNPNIAVDFYASVDNLSERTININLPAELTINKQFSASAEIKADLTRYSTKGYIPNNYFFNNNVVQILPLVKYNGDAFQLNAGIIPTWDNGRLSLLPNIYGEAFLPDKNFSVQAGIVGALNKNTYRNLSLRNPYLLHNNTQVNTKETEIYGGLKTTLGKHFNLSAKLGIVSYNNIALFINDTATDSKGFLIAYEPTAGNLRIHTDASYILQDKLSLTASLTMNGYTGIDVNKKAWHTLPMEFNGSVRYWPLKKLMLKGDLYMFAAPKYIEKGGTHDFTGNASDLSLGAEFTINRQFCVWLNANNLFSNKYERWHNYPVYGINVLGGIIVRF